MHPTQQLAANYRDTSCVDVDPGVVRVRGYPIQELIGTLLTRAAW